MAGETFKLNFISNGEGIVNIDEPIGFDSVPFTLKQKTKGYARDVFFGGDDENKFKFTSLRNHYLETFLYYFETFGWESKVQLIIEKDGIDNIIGDFAFQSAETDLNTYFEAKVVQDNNQALLKRRSELKVNLFSDTDINGDAITPLTTENVLVKSKPITQTSKWVNTEFWQYTGNSSLHSLLQNPIIGLESYNVNDSLVPIDRHVVTSNFQSSPEAIKNLEIIRAENNIVKSTLSFDNIKISYYIPEGQQLTDDTSQTQNTLKPRAQFYIGNEDDFQELKSEFVYFDIEYQLIGTQNVDRFGAFTGDADRYDVSFNKLVVDVGEIPRGYSLYLVFYLDRFNTVTEWLDGEVVFSASTNAYNTIVPSIRLYDAISQVVKSTSGLNTSFPLAEPNGEMYNQRIFNGNLLRNLTDREFNLSLDDIEKWMPEINPDYEVNNDTVFFGLYKDFYTNTEIGVFPNIRFDTYTKTFNPRYALNKFNYKYKKYQSQKESEEVNSYDISHGETEWSIINEYVENKKDVSVEFLRDTFLIDEQRRKGIELDENTSSSDDQTVFILDTKELNQDLSFTETDFLQHTFEETTSQLKITNTGNFNFELLGLAVGDDFSILNDDNEGLYKIVEITNRYIILYNNNGDVENNGERITQFTYIVKSTTAPYISWSDEDFSIIDGIVDTENYANLRYTVKRNITRFYNEYLATCNLFSEKPINNTLYNNNGDLILNYQGQQTIENESFVPTNPILSPYLHEIKVITDFNTFIALQNKIKTDRGYIRTFDSKGHVFKLYVVEMTFKNTDELGELTIKGEEKYNTSLININTGLGYIVINEEYRVLRITYKIEKENVYIMDEHGLLMYNPISWKKLTINGVNIENKEDLIELLDQML